MKKQILSILLVFVMIVGMMPITSFAAVNPNEKITSITSADVTGLYLSKAGEKPDISANVVGEYMEILGIEWYRCTADGERRSSNLLDISIIDSDAYYRVNVTLIPDDNYSFDVSCFEFTINGIDADYTIGNDGSVTGYIIYHSGYKINIQNGSEGVYTYISGKGVSESADEGQQIQLFHGNKGADYEFEGWTVTTKSGLAVAVNSVQSGAGVMYYNFTMPAEDVIVKEIWTVKKIASSIEVTTLPTKTVYNSGEYFDPTGIVVTLNYTDGTKKVLTDEDVELKNLYLSADEKGAINIASSGLKVEQAFVYVSAEGLGTLFPITVNPSTKIYEIAFTMTGYELGGSIDEWSVKVDTEHVHLTSINGVSVVISDRTNLDGSVTFFKNNQHTVQIPIELEAGYEKAFTKENITLNGISADNLRSYNGKYIVTFYLPDFDIRAIDVNITPATSDLTPNDIEITLPQDARYRLLNTSVSWIKLSGEDEYNVIIGNNSKFQAGVTYSAVLTLAPVDNYSFDPNIGAISATINREPIAVEASGDNIVLRYNMTVPEKFCSTLIGDITSFIDNEELITIELFKSGEITPTYTETIIGTIDTPAHYVIPQIEMGEYSMRITKADHRVCEVDLLIESEIVVVDIELAVSNYTVTGYVSSHLNTNDSITVSLYVEGDVTSCYETEITGGEKSFVITGVAFGSYILIAEKAGHLPYCTTFVTNTETIDVNIEMTVFADTNLDGVIDVEDYQALINTVLADDHEQIETEEYDDLIHYDLVMDGYLDVLDCALMALVINGHKTIPEIYDIEKGDFDYDGVAFTESDFIAMENILSDIDASAPIVSTAQKFAADLNYNGKIDEDDLIILKNKFTYLV